MSKKQSHADSCPRKTRFATRAGAWDVVEWMGRFPRNLETAEAMRRVRVYLCGACSRYHIGHVPKPGNRRKLKGVRR